MALPTIGASLAGSGLDPCCCAGNCATRCQQRGGTATYIGFDEFSGYASTPPQKYLTSIYDGTLSGLGFYGAGLPCAESNGLIGSYTLSGGGNWDAVTGVLSGSGTMTTGGNGLFGAPGSVPLYIPSPGLPYFVPGTDTITNATRQIATGNGLCFAHDDMWKSVTGSETCTLSNPDTAANAMARAMVGHAWSSCPACVGCTSWATQRGDTDITFGFQQVQVQASVSSVPGRLFDITISLCSRVLGTAGPFLNLGQQIVVSLTCTEALGVADWTPWIDLPVEDGIEVGVCGCVSVIVP